LHLAWQLLHLCVFAPDVLGVDVAFQFEEDEFVFDALGGLIGDKLVPRSLALRFVFSLPGYLLCDNEELLLVGGRDGKEWVVIVFGATGAVEKFIEHISTMIFIA